MPRPCTASRPIGPDPAELSRVRSLREHLSSIGESIQPTTSETKCSSRHLAGLQAALPHISAALLRYEIYCGNNAWSVSTNQAPYVRCMRYCSIAVRQHFVPSSSVIRAASCYRSPAGSRSRMLFRRHWHRYLGQFVSSVSHRSSRVCGRENEDDVVRGGVFGQSVPGERKKAIRESSLLVPTRDTRMRIEWVRISPATGTGWCNCERPPDTARFQGSLL